MMDSHEYAGRMLLDVHGEAIGSVTDVVSDPVTLEAEWLVVKLGRLAGEHLVPVAAVQDEDGQLRVKVAKEDVRATPKVHQHILPSTAERDSLYRRYGLTSA